MENLSHEPNGGAAPNVKPPVRESREVARKRRQREHMKLKHEADKRWQAESNQIFESISCHCATRCSSTRTDYCELFTAVPLPLTSGPSKTWAGTVRLIRLRSGNECDPIECDLFHASLKGAKHFIALSYVWGSYNDRVAIRVNGRTFNITRNLHAALTHLRSQSAETILWVDAICIDQGNVPERNSQVEHMPQVYSAATQVIAWLGEEADGSSHAMNYINSHFGATNEGLNQHQESICPQLESLWSRPYWSRVWVVQELAAAYRSGNKCFIKCGHHSVTFDQFRHFLGVFLANQFYTEGDSVLGPKRFFNLCIACEEKSFLHILSTSGRLKSTDPRDRVYGIRGISPRFYRLGIQVDYGIHFRELCKRVISAYLKKEKNLNILCQFKSFPRNDHSPSWVRDLSNYSRGISPSIHSASAGSSPNPTISDDILHIKGKCIGVVNLLRGPYKFPSSLQLGQVWPEVPSLKRLKNFIFAELNKRPGDSTPGEIRDRFMNMVSGDRWRNATTGDSGTPFTPREIWDSVSHYKVSSPVDAQMELQYKHFTSLFSPLIGRTLFTTTGSNVGIGPPNMQKGDTVCVLYGFSYCAVLRKLTERHYTFIGPAYVDGAMSGEYVEQEHGMGSTHNIEEQFHIH